MAAFLVVLVVSVFDIQPADGQSYYAGRLDQALQLKEKGDNSKAKVLLQTLVTELESQPPSLTFGKALSTLSQIANSDGDYDAGIRLGRQAATTFHALNDSSLEAKAFNNVGVGELYKGDYAAAAQDLERYRALSEKAHDLENQVQALNNLGGVYLYQSRYQQALLSYQDASLLLRSSPDAPWRTYWQKVTLFNLGTLYQRLGNIRGALDAYQQVEKSLKGLSPADQAHLYANLGTVYRRLDDPMKALGNYQRATALYARERDSDGEIGVLKNIGIVYAMDLNQFNEALRAFTNALTKAAGTGNKRELMQAHLYRGETLLRMHRLSEAATEFETALAGADQLNSGEDRWKALYGLGRVAEESGDGRSAEAKYRAAISQIESLRFKIELSSLRTGFLADKRSVYDALIRMLVGRNDVSGSFDVMEQSRSRVFKEEVKRASKAASTGVSIRDVQNTLPDSGILLEYWLSTNRLAVVWITKEGSGLVNRALSGEESARLAGLPLRFPSNLAQPEAQATLNLLLPAELEAVVARCKRVAVVPDGVLSLFPFDLIWLPGSDKRLVDSSEIVVLPSSILLAGNSEAGKLRLPWRIQMAAFGDPDVGPGEALNFDQALTTPLSPLPFSKREVASVAKICMGRSLQYLASQDQKEQFEKSAGLQAPILHLSTHAVADYERPELSRLLFSPTPGSSRPNYLFLKEVYGLDLRGIDLAVLSACDTERGVIIPGEGLQGFSRAFLAAGAHSTVTTLWRVDDQATAEFMKQFYYFLVRKRQTKGEALRLAKLKFISSGTRYAEPRYWAAFVLSGDASELHPKFLSWSNLSMAAAILIAILTIAAIAFFRSKLLNADRNRSDGSRRVVSEQTEHLHRS